MSGNRFAVLIASSTFPEEPKLLPLACPENDVDGLSKVLSAPDLGGFTEPVVVKNLNAHEVLRKIAEMLKHAGKDDLVLIYYSGHGKLDPSGHLYLATLDTEESLLEATSVPVDRILTMIGNAASTKKALILDCCYSGAAGKAVARVKSGLEDQLNTLSRGSGTFIMTASTATQTAKEKEGDQYGLFTKHLIHGIISGEADRDGDGYITMGEISTYVHDRVPREGAQEPKQWGLNIQGDLVLSKSGRAPREQRRQKVRQKLAELSGQGVLPDRILKAALDVIKMPPHHPTGALRQQDDLLDRLVEGKLRVGDFIGRWLDLEELRKQELELELEPDPPPPSPKQPAGKPAKARRPPAPEPEPRPPPREPEKPTFAKWLLSRFISIVILMVHLLGAGVMAGLISELTTYSTYSKGYRLDEEMAAVVAAVGVGLLIVLGGIRLRIRGATKGKPDSVKLYERVFPRWYNPRTASSAASLGLLAFIGLTLAALVAELDRVM